MEAAEKLSFMSAILPFVVVVFIIAIGVILLTQQFRKNLYRQQLKQEELKNKHQIDLLNASILAQEEERKRIARNMHDQLGASLSIARMHLLQAEKNYGPTEEKLLRDLQNIRSLTENSLESMRRLSHELMPPQLEDFGLVKTLEILAQQINTSGELNVQLDIQDNFDLQSWPLSLTLYRIVAELVTNTIRHAGASRIHILLSHTGPLLELRYSDNGRGLGKNGPNKGIGLKSIEGRVQAVGGLINWMDKPEKGFNVQISIPEVAGI